MLKRALVTTSLVALAALLLATGVQAGQTKYTFNDVTIGETVVEIEAAVKDTKKNDYSSCSYYSDDYGTWLGDYQDEVFAGETADQVESFCVEHFDDRTQ